jgi:hypothetical protein
VDDVSLSRAGQLAQLAVSAAPQLEQRSGGLMLRGSNGSWQDMLPARTLCLCAPELTSARPLPPLLWHSSGLCLYCRPETNAAASICSARRRRPKAPQLGSRRAMHGHCAGIYRGCHGRSCSCSGGGSGNGKRGSGCACGATGCWF